MPTATLEEYLEAIFKLSEKGRVRPTPIAESLGVSGATVTATLKRLQEQGYVSRKRGDVVLTPTGRATALEIVRRHRVAERFLVDVLGISWDEVHEDACRLEHALSPRVLEALEDYLKNPSVCPHGHPIPNSNGDIPDVVGAPLSGLGAGSDVEIIQVTEEEDAMLAYLGSMGMFPGTRARIREVAPFRGPLMLEVGESTYAIGRDVADRILVRVVEHDPVTEPVG